MTLLFSQIVKCSLYDIQGELTALARKESSIFAEYGDRCTIITRITLNENTLKQDLGLRGIKTAPREIFLQKREVENPLSRLQCNRQLKAYCAFGRYSGRVTVVEIYSNGLLCQTTEDSDAPAYVCDECYRGVKVSPLMKKYQARELNLADTSVVRKTFPADHYAIIKKTKQTNNLFVEKAIALSQLREKKGWHRNKYQGFVKRILERVPKARTAPTYGTKAALKEWFAKNDMSPCLVELARIFSSTNLTHLTNQGLFEVFVAYYAPRLVLNPDLDTDKREDTLPGRDGLQISDSDRPQVHAMLSLITILGHGTDDLLNELLDHANVAVSDTSSPNCLRLVVSLARILLTSYDFYSLLLDEIVKCDLNGLEITSWDETEISVFLVSNGNEVLSDSKSVVLHYEVRNKKKESTRIFSIIGIDQLTKMCEGSTDIQATHSGTKEMLVKQIDQNYEYVRIPKLDKFITTNLINIDQIPFIDQYHEFSQDVGSRVVGAYENHKVATLIIFAMGIILLLLIGVVMILITDKIFSSVKREEMIREYCYGE